MKTLTNHRVVSAGEFWELAWKEVKILPWMRTRVGTGGATFLMAVDMAMAYFRRNAGKKNYLTYGWYKPGRGMSAKHLARAVQYVIDLDTAGVANWEQLEMVSRMFPKALILRTNGIQIFLRPSGKGWAHDVYHLEAMGKMIAAMTGLKYDAHHVRKDGTPTSHENHNYRSPVGWSSRRKAPVECYAPLDDQWDVLEASTTLGLNVIIPKDLFVFAEQPYDEDELPPEVPSKVAARQSYQVSQGDKVEECRAFMKMRFDLLMKGLPIHEAERRVCERRWRFYSAADIQACFKRWPSIYRPPTGSGVPFLDNSLDQKVYTGFLGLISKKRRGMQRTFGLFAHRAWCVEFFTSMGFNAEEATGAFMNWPECKPLKRLSVEAIGEEEVRRDIERCVLKFGDGKGAQPADPKLVEGVKRAAEAAGSFRARELLKTVEVRSLRHLQTILKMLMDRGELRKVGGSKNTKWVWIRAAHIGIDKPPPGASTRAHPSAPPASARPAPVDLQPPNPEPSPIHEEEPVNAVLAGKLAAEETDHMRKLVFYRLGTMPPPHLSQMAPYRPKATPEQLSAMSRLERMAYATRNILPNPYNPIPRQRACVAYEKQLRKKGSCSEEELAALISLFRWTGKRLHNRALPGMSNLKRLTE